MGSHESENSPSSLQLGVDVWEFPVRDEAAQQLQQLSHRGFHLHSIYSSGVREYFNHAGQFVAMFPELKGDPVRHPLFSSENRSRRFSL